VLVLRAGVDSAEALVLPTDTEVTALALDLGRMISYSPFVSAQRTALAH
jgi:hypothetical protein